MKKYLIIVDMQEDFVTGSLGTPEARAIVQKIADYAKDFDGKIVFTRDSHGSDYLDTQEGTFLPVKHCVTFSEGWEFVEPLEEIRTKLSSPVYAKRTFGCVNLAIDLSMERQWIDQIEFVGVCTDICVISNALLLKAYMPEVPIIVHSDMCAGVTPEKHNAAIETMKSCQIIVK